MAPRWLTAVLVGVVVLLGVPPGPAGAANGEQWGWPLPGIPTVLRPFQPPPTPYAAGHRGVDLVAPVGASVLAAGTGVIGYAGRLAGRGVVTVVHGPLRTTYEPVTAVVQAGQSVRVGEQIGRLEPPTGHCGIGRSCLHWGLLRGDSYLDPLALLHLSPPILLPLGSLDAGTRLPTTPAADLGSAPNPADSTAERAAPRAALSAARGGVESGEGGRGGITAADRRGGKAARGAGRGGVAGAEGRGGVAGAEGREESASDGRQDGVLPGPWLPAAAGGSALLAAGVLMGRRRSRGRS